MFTDTALQRPFAPDGGHAVTARIPDVVQDALRAGAEALLVEDGVTLGPANALHDSIRASGRGAFSVWGPQLYFSASDNSDCNRNGRAYALRIVDLAPGSRLHALAQDRFSRDGELLEGIALNRARNKSLFSNFFGYFNHFAQALRRHDLPMPGTAFEIGCGERPYTALRFLKEGVGRCVVNDLAPVETSFPRLFLEHLEDVAQLVSPGPDGHARRLSTRDAGGGLVRVDGLEARDRCPFETLQLDETFEFIYSVSVLEHVMAPAAVVARMHALLTPGGHACHSIDLRDHGHFDDPLRFLRLTEADYDGRRTENRLRASDWLQLFAAAGFRLLECEYVSYDAPASSTAHYGFEPPAGEAWVESQRAGFAAPFADKSASDLSTLAIRVLYEKTA